MMALSGIETQSNKAAEKLKNEEEMEGGQPTESPVRPPRKRKGVDRFLIEDVPRRSATRKIVIFQGNGTPLKDIPNVAYNLSKRKTDNNLVLLHIILFGKKAKVQMLKKNVGLFSGFLWVEEEEKQRSKVRKKLDQCVKAKLLDFCDILDIPVNKATIKKEDLSAIVLKFLESPHPTTETLLADKKKTRNPRAGAKQKLSKDEEQDKNDESSIGEDYPQEDCDDSERDREEEQAPHVGKHAAVRKVYLKPPKPTSRKRSSCSSSKEGTSEAESVSKASEVKKPKVENKPNNISEAESKRKSSSVKKLNVGKERNKVQNSSVRKTSSTINPSSIPRAKTKIVGQGKVCKTEEVEIPGEEMKTVLADILKKADLNTTTLAYILGQLGAHFNMDLTHRRSEVKALITDIVNKMMDEEEDLDTGNDIDNVDDNDTYYN